jgi:hypothetical protein
MMKGLLIAGLGAVVLGVGVVVAQGVGAQSGEETPSQSRGERFIAETAERLGVTPEALTEAMTGAEIEMIDEAVAEGKLSEEKAAKLKERIAEKGPLAGIRLRHHKGGGGGKGLCHLARLVGGAAAQVLGKDPTAVAEAVKAGESLAEQAAAAGMSVEDFKAALLAAVKADLQAKVDAGETRQKKADRVYAGIEEHIDRIVNFEGGRGFCRDRGDRQADEPNVEETPVQGAPVEETPVEPTPAEESPVEETPPVEATPAQETPVEETPVEGTPLEETPS